MGVAAAIGQPLSIPVITRSLGQHMYRLGMIQNGQFRLGLELIAYLDGNLSSNGLDDPALNVTSFYLSWWDTSSVITERKHYLRPATLQSALIHHRQQLQEAHISCGPPQPIGNVYHELEKPAFVWHSSINDDLPNDCTRCRLYRSVAVGVVDRLRDTYNMVHASQIVNEAERDLAIRRASGFNELFEAALKKECDENRSVQSASGQPKDYLQPEVEGLKKMCKDLITDAGSKECRKWTWGIDLTDDDLYNLVWGADRYLELPHSGYDDDLQDDLPSMTTEALDPAKLEMWDDKDLRFDEVSKPITIPELQPHEFPDFSAVQFDAFGEPVVPIELDPMLEPFIQREKEARKKASKMLMQEEVDCPVAFFNYGTEFVKHHPFVPCRPWLIPHLPLIPPPSNIARHIPNRPGQKMPHAFNEYRDGHPDTTEDDPDHIEFPESDDIPDHIIMQSDEHESQITFPISDDNDDGQDHRMDVVTSHGAAEQMAGSDSDNHAMDSEDIYESDESVTDHIVLGDNISGSPMDATVRSVIRSGFQRDPNTGHFTSASFAHFPDDLLD